MTYNPSFIPTDATMITWQWQGFTSIGESIQGAIDAPSRAIAKNQLRQQGLVVHKIKRQPTSLFHRDSKKIAAHDITLFTRQIATMITAGISILQALTISQQGQKNRQMQRLLHAIQQDITCGHTFTESLQKHPLYFNGLYCSLIDAGEQSGSLDKLLDKITIYLEKMALLKQKIKKALIYPAILLTTALLVTAILLLFVVPQFETLFASVGAPLPQLTRIVLNISLFCRQKAWIVLVIGGIGGYLGSYLQRTVLTFSHKLDDWLLHVPIIGQIIKKAAIARFSQTLSITFSSGLPLMNALQISAGVMDNHVLKSAVNLIQQDIATGQSLHWAMQRTQLFPDMVMQMLAIGEESGKLETMLDKIVAHYTQQVDHTVETLHHLLEPMILLILGVLIGGLVVAMYLPIFRLGAVI